MRRRAVLALAAAVLAAGCGSPAPQEAPVAAVAGPHNETDVMFLQMVLDHHRQGAELVALAADRGRRPEVRQLAARMKQQWADESRTMTAWLQGWGAPLEADQDAGVHAGHGDLHSLRPSDIEELKAAGEADFDRTALSLLLGHLHNTVEVARMESGKGANADAKALAGQITTTRQEQVQQMLKLLAS
ncbi:DUF305 domain-containing protein [Spirilliplanes yamanashiensis]|uniref:DUF305 domain-containing protein n=1 Tax=Spirilliplanes yamanashiensis TaxID=42233 RepID=A0A8J4DKF9_9ACTN|nr:DUF305 domain-containing protein [Spirilliplanes yamanashiensis]MDP9818032.1 uncharacterized protein (DUF305 family) [Spirilliplanes yamanashiensis]GIJ04841.1 DUF305 domain-containing protein [Spirilliplanes yamanashiensis]